MKPQFCPECGALAHRSRSRNFGERVVKLFSSYKTYRCPECGWRGWLRPSRGKPGKTGGPEARTILTVIVGLLLTALIAVYLIQRFNDIPGP